MIKLMGEEGKKKKKAREENFVANEKKCGRANKTVKKKKICP